MIAAWMLFTVVVSGAIALAALGAERLFRHAGVPLRFAWSAGLVAAVLLPAVRLSGLLPERSVAAPDASAPSGVFVLEGLSVTVPQGSATLLVDQWALTGWGILSCGLLALTVGALLSLRARARAWQATTVLGGPAWISEDTGPAVTGVLTPRIVLPRWALDAPDLPLMVAHEREHVRAGDGRLLAGAWALLLLVPWNAPLWWMVRRLRAAIESDCDARVLAKGDVRLRDYCELLLRVGARRSPGLLPAPALSEPASLLERRIDVLTARGRLGRTLRLVVGASVAVALGVACFTPQPEAGGPLAPELPEAGVTAADVTAGPTFTPFTVRPDLKNRQDVQAALVEEYPPLLRDAGVQGTVNVWFFIRDDGVVGDVRVQESSGHPALDEAALEVARVMEFTPALNGDDPVPVWVAFPITFQTASSQASVPVRPSLNGGETGRLETPEGVAYTPFTERPGLVDVEALQATLQAEYPPLLREAGITGTTLVWFHIDETGTVTDARVGRSSEHEALDEAALRVARAARFTPARNRGETVAVWVAFPIRFEPPTGG